MCEIFTEEKAWLKSCMYIVNVMGLGCYNRTIVKLLRSSKWHRKLATDQSKSTIWSPCGTQLPQIGWSNVVLSLRNAPTLANLGYPGYPRIRIQQGCNMGSGRMVQLYYNKHWVDPSRCGLSWISCKNPCLILCFYFFFLGMKHWRRLQCLQKWIVTSLLSYPTQFTQHVVPLSLNLEI